MTRLFNNAASEYLYRDPAVLTGYPLAMLCWFNLDEAATGTLIALSDKDTTADFHMLRYLNTPYIEAFSRRSTDAYARGGSPQINVWNHACAIFASATDRRVWLNGASVATNNTDKTPTNLDRTGIGFNAISGGGSYISGHIAEAAIYDLTNWPGATNALKADAFEKILPSLAKGFSPQFFPLGLVAYWPLVRDLNDKIKGQNLTASGTVVSPHSKVIYPICPRFERYRLKILLAGSADGISGVSGSLDLQPEFISSTDGIFGASGSLDSQPGFISSTDETSGASGSLDIIKEISFESSSAGISGVSGSLLVATELQGSTVGISGVSGSLLVATELQGSTDGISGASGSLLVATELQGSIDGVSGASGSLDLQPEFISSTDGISGVSGSLDLQPRLISFTDGVSGVFGSLLVATELQSSTVGISGAFGSLNVSKELGSSIVEISGVSASLGSLNVLTLLVAPSDETSNAFGQLSFLIFVAGSTNGTSDASGSLDLQPEFISSTIGISGAVGSLNVIIQLQSLSAGTSGAFGYLEILKIKIYFPTLSVKPTTIFKHRFLEDPVIRSDSKNGALLVASKDYLIPVLYDINFDAPNVDKEILENWEINDVSNGGARFLWRNDQNKKLYAALLKEPIDYQLENLANDWNINLGIIALREV